MIFPPPQARIYTYASGKNGNKDYNKSRIQFHNYENL